ncbi:MAG: hypothetical protein ACOZCK_05080 [Pseudomonadota bacterium]|jgi:hypothetical protein
MPIAGNELIFRRAALASDTVPAQNGGRMTSAAVVSSVKNNLFPDVTQAQRLAGAEHYRKVFLHVASAAEAEMIDAKVFLEDVTPGDGYVLLYAGTQSDTQNEVIGRPYGVGRLAAAIAADALQLVVDFEHAEFANLRPIRVGDAIRVANMPATGGSGAEAFAMVDNVIWSGLTATVTLTAALGAAFDPAAGSVTVASVLTYASIKAGATVPVSATAGGTHSGAKPAGSNRGTVLQNWTLTFTSSTAFRLDGDVLGVGVASGTTAAAFSPANPAGGVYFSIPSDVWGGSWVAGDTLTFSTEPAAIPLWLQRVTPAGAASVSGDNVAIGIQGESA